MITQTQTVQTYSPEDYLELKLTSDTRHEYINEKLCP